MSPICTDRPAAPASVLHKIVEDGAPASMLACTGRSCARHFSHSVKLTDVTEKRFEWLLGKNNVI